MGDEQWQKRLPEPPPPPARPDAQALAYLEAKRQIEIKTIGLAAAIAAGAIAVNALVVYAFFYSSP